MENAKDRGCEVTPDKKSADTGGDNRGTGQGRASLSLLLMVLAVAAVYLWNEIFEYPPEAEVRLVGGLLELETRTVMWITSAVTGMLGLTSIVSFTNPKEFLAHGLNPFKKRDPTDELLLFWSSSGILILGGMFFLAALNLILSNWSAVLRSDYEILVTVPRSSGASLIEGSGDEVQWYRLKKGGEGKLTIRGLNASAVIVFRDDLSLIVLEAMCLERLVLRTRMSPCEVQEHNPAADLAERDLRSWGAMRYRIPKRLRWSEERVINPIILEDGKLREGGFLEPGEPRDGPEEADVPYAARFQRSLYWDRETMRAWLEKPFVEKNGRTYVIHRIWGYDLRIDYEELRFEDPGGSEVVVRTAKTIRALEKDMQPPDFQIE